MSITPTSIPPRQVMIIGGARNSKYVEWFGNTVMIDGVKHVLRRIHFSNDFATQCYVREGVLIPPSTMYRVEVCK